MKKKLLELDNVGAWEKALQKTREGEWLRRGERATLRLFHQMAKRVPAYRKFLKKSKISPASIRSAADLKKIPPTNKENYLRAYPLTELSWDGTFPKHPHVISATSGSTGEPFYFPRTPLQDEQYALLAELYLRENFSIHKKRTLYVNAFPLGVWIGGLFTYAALTRLAERGGYDLSVINPGVHPDAAIKAVQKLAKDYDQVIIGSYGPFLKNILEEGRGAGVNWKKLDLGFIFSAEGFSESFRDHILEHTKKSDPFRATLNHYGTVDLGTMSYETPLAILARRLIVDNPALRREIFQSDHKVPTLTQYIPELFYFEQDPRGQLLCSANAGLPLVRYELKDSGHVYTFEKMQNAMLSCGIDLERVARQNGLGSGVWRLPFVQVFERADFSVSYYAFQVYPETIRRALFSSQFRNILTGRFTMRKSEDKAHDPVLEIHVELMRGIRKASASMSGRIVDAVHTRLMKESSEYQKTHSEKGSKVVPHIIYWPYNDPNHFSVGGKQKWVK